MMTVRYVAIDERPSHAAQHRVVVLDESELHRRREVVDVGPHDLRVAADEAHQPFHQREVGTKQLLAFHC